MFVRAMFNLQSRPAMFMGGALGLAAAFMDASQGLAASGMNKVALLGIGTVCFMFGGALVVASFSGLTDQWKKRTDTGSLPPQKYDPQEYKAALNSQLQQQGEAHRLLLQRNDRIADAAGALALGTGAGLLEKDGGAILAGIMTSFAIGKLALAATDQYRLYRLNQTERPRLRAFTAPAASFPASGCCNRR